jgi:hypothetical protein
MLGAEAELDEDVRGEDVDFASTPENWVGRGGLRAEPGAVVLRTDRQQPHETATHRFLRSEAAALRDALGRQT